ncbi:hypothetical protein FOL47_000104 [Perkinsus chesapeaki]|uniref:SCP domain-containing protein n=1 Tax=Perkinsus chesapeaki TaxID=330153 RepID=A0A7J6N1X1_PERCH|nr:hypothetical protein FOL47_000104 [Perkinsus chesapeaki]
MSTARSYFDIKQNYPFYAAYHMNKWNKVIHMICVPIIYWTSLFLIRRYTPALYEGITLATLVHAFYLLSFWYMDWPAAFLYTPIMMALYLISANLPLKYTPQVWFIFCTAWILQFIGHGFLERRRPALVDNFFQSIHAAVFFVWLQIMFRAGYKPDLDDELVLLTQKELERAGLENSAEQKKADSHHSPWANVGSNGLGWTCVTATGGRLAWMEERSCCEIDGSFEEAEGSEGWVKDHNYFRCLHGADPVQWSTELEANAKQWAAYLAEKGGSLEHSDTYGAAPYAGENLAMGYGAAPAVCNGSSSTNTDFNQHCAVWLWYNEYNEYMKGHCNEWTDISGIGHFTAMIWKGINRIGCANASNYYVCKYGHTDCMTEDPNGAKYGGANCWEGVPSKLANFNKGLCPLDGTCVGCRVDQLENDAEARREQCGAGPLEEQAWDRSNPTPSAAKALSVLVMVYVGVIMQALPNHPFAL